MGSDLRLPTQKGQRSSLAHTGGHQEKQEPNPGVLLSGLGLLPGHWVAYKSVEEISREHEFKGLSF